MNWTTPCHPVVSRLLSNPSERAVAVTNVPPPLPPPQPVQQVVLQFSGRLSASLIFTSHPGDHPPSLALTLDFASYRPTSLVAPPSAWPVASRSSRRLSPYLRGFFPPIGQLAKGIISGMEFVVSLRDDNSTSIFFSQGIAYPSSIFFSVWILFFFREIIRKYHASSVIEISEGILRI